MGAVRIADWRELSDMLDAISTTGFHALVIKSSDPRVFPFEFRSHRSRNLGLNARGCRSFAIAMGRGIAAIAGPCHGAGAAIAMACDPSSRPACDNLDFPAKFGVSSYPGGDIRRLAWLIGRARAARLVSAEAIDAREVVLNGWSICSTTTSRHASRNPARKIAANSVDSIAFLKGALDNLCRLKSRMSSFSRKAS